MAGEGLRRWLGLLARLTVAVVLLAFVVRSIELERVLEVLRQTRGQYVGLSIGVFLLTILVAAFRLQILLGAQSIRMTFLSVFRLSIIAQLFHSILPSNVGGDAYRVYDVARVSKEGGTAAVVILADRLSGLVGLLLLVFAAMLLGYGQFQREVLVVTGLVGIGMTIMILVWAGRGFAHRLVGKLSLGLAMRLGGLLSGGEQAIASYRGNLAVLAGAIVVSLATLSLLVMTVFLMAKAVGIEVSLIHFFVLIPVSNLIFMVPASIGGVGVREGVYVYFFSRLGVPPEVALSLSIMMYLPRAVVGLAGVFLLLSGRESTGRAVIGPGAASSGAPLSGENAK